MSFRTLYLVASVLQVACLGIGGYLAVRGQMTAAMLFAAINYFTSISNGLTNVMDYIINIRSTKEVTKKLNSERDKSAPPESAPIRETAPAVEYEDVSFSFGERQRISIARAMRVHPSIMVFDEPTTGLDPENVELIENFIFRQGDMTRIVITHNWSEAYLRRFDDVIRIGDPPEELAQRTVPAL